jgi:hypothetical protein
MNSLLRTDTSTDGSRIVNFSTSYGFYIRSARHAIRLHIKGVATDGVCDRQNSLDCTLYIFKAELTLKRCQSSRVVDTKHG